MVTDSSSSAQSAPEPQRSPSTPPAIDLTIQAVLDSLPAHIAVLDATGTVIAVNAAWHRFAQANGYVDAGHGIGLNYLEICRQASGDAARAAEQGIRAVIANEQAEFSYDYLIHGPGEQRWFLFRAVPFAGDGPIGAIISHEDITRYKRIDDRARPAEAISPSSHRPSRWTFDTTKGYLQALFDHVQDAFLLADDEGRYIEANAAACVLTGYSRAELLRLSIADLTPMVDRQQLPAHWQAFIESGFGHGEYMIRRKDARYVPVEFHAVARIMSGVHLSVLRDISVRKQAEDALRNHAKRLNVLHEIDHAILSAESLEQVAQAALRAIHQLTPYWRGSVIVFDFDLHELQAVAVCTRGELSPGPSPRRPIAEVLKAEEIIARIQGGDICVLDLRDLAPDWPEAEAMLAAGIRYQICTPLIAQDELFGSLQIVTPTLEVFDAAYMPIIREVVASLAIALRQARLFEQVRAGSERLQELSRRLVAAQEQERRQIARELHDQVGQSLAVLNMHLAITRDQLSGESAARVDERLAAAIRIVEETVDQIRGVMAELRPAILDDYGLVAALRWYARHFAQHTDLAVLLDIEEPRAAPRLPPELETALFRIAQEALTNIIKHARASLATLKLAMLDRTVRLTITDDGIGFDAGAARRPKRRFSLGLMTMQERVEAFGGRLLIDSAPGQGTRITAEVVR